MAINKMMLYLFILAIPCQDLEAPANGRIEFSSSSSSTQRPGDKATYSCSAGFNLVGGTRIRVCKQDGSYSGQAPSCKREIKCMLPLTGSLPNLHDMKKNNEQACTDARTCRL